LRLRLLLRLTRLLSLGLMVLLTALMILPVLVLRIGQGGSSSEERKHQECRTYNRELLHGLASR
jgi:hypothetical protein